MFLHQTTTFACWFTSGALLYIIMFLHQTTTNVVPWSKQGWLYIIMFLHQTTTVASQLSASASCILSCSYIKPQLYAYSLRFPRVVYYHVPTSNHNCHGNVFPVFVVVYYHVPTSNHNCEVFDYFRAYVVYYHVPTSNHNLRAERKLDCGVVY